MMSSIRIQFAVTLQATPERVWQGLIEQLDKWWSSDFYTSERTRRFVIEPRVGGRMYEDFGDHSGVLWAHVIAIDPPRTLELKGHLSPRYGGPAISFLTLRLKAEKDGTVLDLTDCLIGDVNESTKNSLESGWKTIFQQRFKSFVELNL